MGVSDVQGDETAVAQPTRVQAYQGFRQASPRRERQRMTRLAAVVKGVDQQRRRPGQGGWEGGGLDGEGADGVSARYSVTSRDLLILMDQPAKPISSGSPPGRRQDNWFAGLERRRLPQGAVRAVAVVVVGVLDQHRP
jgi:hypothetical protein